MKMAVVTVVLVFAALFLLTTFPRSSRYEHQAAADQFSAEDIEDGWRLAVQRKLLMWAGTFATLGFLLAVACTGRARRLADRFGRWAGGRWWLAVLLMGAFCFAAENLLLFPVRVLALENARAWGLSHQGLGDWLLDQAKGLGLAAAFGAPAL